MFPIPEDDNKNKIADYWEDFVKMKDKDAKEDVDNFPEKQNGNGDGLTLFEEYRGFNQVGELTEKKDAMIVDGKHVRTDPDYKDAFICDETKLDLFMKHYGNHNAAKFNWHIVDKDEIILGDAAVINAVLLNVTVAGKTINAQAAKLKEQNHLW